MLIERPEDVPFGGPTQKVDVPNALRDDAPIPRPKVRTFETGATRDTDDGKHDPEGFLSYRVIERFNEYMHHNRIQRDGSKRDSDNWQLGITRTAYMKSMWRHFLEVWGLHRESLGKDRDARREEALEVALCAVMFNAMGFLHEVLRGRS